MVYINRGYGVEDNKCAENHDDGADLSFFLNKHGKESQVCENLHFSTFSIYVMSGLLTVAHKRHYRGMVSHKKYITLLSTN